jgi:Zn-dependent protease
LEQLLYVLPILLFSVVVHEYAHGYVALRWGDPTAAMLGRLTLNPLPHIDPIGSVLVPLLLTLAHLPLLGWARPVPVTRENYRNRRWGDITVSLAGPASNVLLALLFTGLGILAWRLLGPDPVIGQVLSIGIHLNLILAMFNLLPIPPLDGSHVVYNILPQPMAYNYMSMARFGFLILILLLALPPGQIVLDWLVWSPASLGAQVLFRLVNRAG